MKVIPYIYENHRNALQRMFQAHEMPKQMVYQLPDVGFIAMEKNMVIAAGFLRQIEGDLLCIFDGLISNPEATSEQRNLALNLVIIALQKKAKFFNFKRILAWTRDKNTLVRAEKLGFEKTEDQLLIYRGE